MEPVVSLNTAPKQLVEAEESVASINFSLSAPPPPTGLTVSLKASNLADFSLGKAQVTGGTITLEPALQRTLQQALDGTREADVPGATIAIISPAGSWFGTSGVANIQTRAPLKADDRFQIGSITKTFVATTVLQLVQEGKLSLDDKLTKLLPDRVTKNIPNAANITLKQLLQHTSGIADYTDVLFTQAATNPGVFLQEWQPEELVGLINGVPPLVNPGEAWRYSSTNFILAGLIIEETTGKTIGREIRDRILTPLGLKNTFFATEETVTGGVVSGYWDFDRDGRLNDITGASLSWAGAAGAMVSNTQDLDTFARNLFKGNLLKPEILAQMLTTVPTNEPDNYSSYGLGVGTIESTNRLWYIHRGQTLGYRSNMWYEPKEDLTYIELINGFSRDNLSRDVLRPYREGIVDKVFNFTITSQNAEIRLPVTQDNIVEGTEMAIFSLESGTGYSVNSQAQSGEFTISEVRNPPPLPILVPITITSSTTKLVENQGSILKLDFTVEGGSVPVGGVPIRLTGDRAQILLEFLAGEIEFESPTETEFEFIESLLQADGVTVGAVSPDFSSFDLILTKPTASLSFKVFDDIFEEGTETFTYKLETEKKVTEDFYFYAPKDQADSVTFSISDGVPAGIGPKVGITANQTALYDTKSILTNYT
jgi:CubicO group peptidase (beta-lactamase class C family)